MATETKTATPTRLTAVATSTRPSTTTARPAATAKKAVRKARKATKRTVRKAAETTKKTVNAAIRAATTTTDTMANATRQYTDFFKQTPFKLENMMNTQSYPQFDAIQNQLQNTANQCTAYISKASAAAEKSQKRLASGLQECGQTVASMTQANMQRTTEAMRQLATCRTLNEFADVQTRLFKQNFDAMTTETSRLVEQVTKCMASASEPMSDLAAEGMTQMKKTMAA